MNDRGDRTENLMRRSGIGDRESLENVACLSHFRRAFHFRILSTWNGPP